MTSSKSSCTGRIWLTLSLIYNTMESKSRGKNKPEDSGCFKKKKNLCKLYTPLCSLSSWRNLGEPGAHTDLMSGSPELWWQTLPSFSGSKRSHQNTECSSRPPKGHGTWQVPDRGCLAGQLEFPVLSRSLESEQLKPFKNHAQKPKQNANWTIHTTSPKHSMEQSDAPPHVPLENTCGFDCPFQRFHTE